MGGVVMTYSYEVREKFVELVCGGASLRAATAAVGVSHGVGLLWWRACGRMDLQIVTERPGGLRGTAPPPMAGAAEQRRGGSVRRRRLLSSEDRAVIAAGLRAGWSYARIGR